MRHAHCTLQRWVQARASVASAATLGEAATASPPACSAASRAASSASAANREGRNGQTRKSMAMAGERRWVFRPACVFVDDVMCTPRLPRVSVGARRYGVVRGQRLGVAIVRGWMLWRTVIRLATVVSQHARASLVHNALQRRKIRIWHTCRVAQSMFLSVCACVLCMREHTRACAEAYASLSSV